MNLNHLKYFVDSVKEGSLQKAASLNHVTPGAISQAILKLEQDFNINLIHHSKNRFEVTEHGQILYSSSHKLFSSLHTILTKMEDAKDPYSGELNFGTQHSIAETVLPSILRDFKNHFPKVKTNFNLSYSEQTKKLLSQRELSFVITMDHFDFRDHTKILLKEGDFLYISSSKAQKNLDQGFLVTGYATEIYKLDNLYKKKIGKDLPIHMRIDSWVVIKKMALEGHGIGFIPDYILNPNEKKYTLEDGQLPQIKYHIYCVYPKNHVLNEKSLALIETFKKAFQ